jgi:3-oxoacyl-[acyl-carrier protein] reductase
MANASTDVRKVAVVLAASRGLGRACAEALAGSHRLVLCARGEQLLDTLANDLRGQGAEVATAVVDLSTPEGVDRVFATADETFGRVDVLVANAGGPPPGAFMSLDEEAWRVGFELTLMSAVRSIRQAIPRMQAVGGGRVLILGSSSVRAPIDNLVISNTYRPGLAGLVKSLAVEFAPQNITVNMVSPGRMETDRVRQLDEAAAERQGVDVDTVRERSIARIPMGRYGKPEELAAMVAFLASDEAGYITGQSVLVDGGMVPTLP